MAKSYKFTEEVKSKVLQALALGATYELASNFAGITYQTLYVWRKRGEEEDEGEYHDFMVAVREAEGRAAIGWLAKIEEAATDGNWQAAAWKLERRHRQDYALQYQRVEQSGEITIKIEYDE